MSLIKQEGKTPYIKAEDAEQYLSQGKILAKMRPLMKTPIGVVKQTNKQVVDETPQDQELDQVSWKDLQPHSDNEKAQIKAHKGNLGFVLRDRDIVIDVDPKGGGIASYEKLLKDLKDRNDGKDITFEHTVETQSGGFHVYLTVPEGMEDVSFRKQLPKVYPGIDFLQRDKQYCIIPSSAAKGDDGEIRFYKWANPERGFFQVEAPKHLLDIWFKDNNRGKEAKDKDKGQGQKTVSIVGGEAAPQAALGAPDTKAISKAANATSKAANKGFTRSKGVAADELRHYIGYHNPNMGYEEWLEIMMAAHSWSTTEGYPIFVEWSSKGSTHDDGKIDIRKHWDGLDQNGAFNVETIVWRAIHNHQAPLWQDPSKPNKPSKTKVQKATEARKERKAAEKVGSCGDFRDKWGVVLHEGKYYELSKMTGISEKMFNLRCGPDVPPGPKGGKVTASTYISTEGGIRLADRSTYLPAEKARLVNKWGLTLLNTFCPERMPKTAKEFTQEGLDAIELFLGLLRFICGTEERFNILMCWIACQVQHMGVKMPWAPFIQSSQGTGKGVIGVVLKAILGNHNVRLVPASNIVGQFTGWQYGTAVNIMNEWTVPPKDKEEAANKMKSVITDRDVSVNQKNIEAYEGINITNYICFTNSKDAIILEENDRRYWIIFSKLDNVVKEIPKLTGMKAEDYYNLMLKPFLEDNEDIIGQFRKHFMEYAIPASFRAINRAPNTPEKTAMLKTQYSLVEGEAELRELVAKGSRFYNERVIASGMIFGNLEDHYTSVEKLTNNQKAKLLKTLGFTKHGRVRYGQSSFVVWTKATMTTEEIKAEFDNFIEVVPKEDNS